MTINFYLKSKTEPSLLSVRYRHRGIVYQRSLEMTIDPEQWDGSRLKIPRSRIITKEIEERQQTNQYLDRVEIAMRQAHFDLLVTGSITKETIRDKFLENMGIKEQRIVYLIDWVDKVIRDRKASGRFSKGTIKTLNTCRNKLNEYESKKGRNLTFDEIDMNFFHDFMAHLAPNDYRANYLNKIISNIKVFMNEALEAELHTNTRYQSKKFHVAKEEVYNVYLTQDELQLIYEKGPESLASTKYRFLVAANTGLRYVDISRLSKANFVDGKIHIIPSKDKKRRRLIIPVTPMVRMIMQRFNYELPKANANPVMNRQIKKICRLAGIKDPVMKDGKAFKKHELVTIHTARRSFATNALKAGISPIMIMQITGHRTESNFMKYIKLSADEYADLMSKNQFFTGIKVV